LDLLPYIGNPLTGAGGPPRRERRRVCFCAGWFLRGRCLRRVGNGRSRRARRHGRGVVMRRARRSGSRTVPVVDPRFAQRVRSPVVGSRAHPRRRALQRRALGPSLAGREAPWERQPQAAGQTRARSTLQSSSFVEAQSRLQGSNMRLPVVLGKPRIYGAFRVPRLCAAMMRTKTDDRPRE
jgi:hypothetical protein